MRLLRQTEREYSRELFRNERLTERNSKIKIYYTELLKKYKLLISPNDEKFDINSQKAVQSESDSDTVDSDEEIDEMRVKHGLEGCAYSGMNETEDGEKRTEELSEEKKEIINAYKKTIQWMETSNKLDTKAFKDKHEELQALVKPIFDKM